MTSFVQRCGVDNEARRNQVARLRTQIADDGIEQLRFSWCDQHGMLRSKTLTAGAACRALDAGLGMVGSLLLKDSSDHTAYRIFEPDAVAGLPGFAGAANLVLVADPASYRRLPWARNTGWLLCQPWFPDAQPVAIDTRRVLQQALARLDAAGYRMQCGLEVEFHIYRIVQPPDAAIDAALDPVHAAWPGHAPQVALVHPGYNLLSEAWADMAHAPLQIVQQTAQALGLPLASLEIELGPSQVEAVFDVTDALTAADNMVLFRSATLQALRRAGYHATFMCRPPFPGIMSSGWHLHQSLVSLRGGSNAFMRTEPATDAAARDAQRLLSDTGEHYLAGLLRHAAGMAVFCTPTVNGYGRFQPNALAPQRAVWGHDNRGAMLRVVAAPWQHGGCFEPDPATRIENRIGEPAANPYLYLASQVHAGLDGIERRLTAPAACDRPYAADTTDAPMLPTSLGDALDALRADKTLVEAFGTPFVDYLETLKRAELARFEQAHDPQEWHSREYFSRI